MMRSYTLEYWPDEDWLVGRLREVPGVFSQGQTLDDLKENIVDAYRMMIETQEHPENAIVQTLEMNVEV
mgnify:CR=1 FL=1